ncbi:MAG: hypothetical protein Q8Q67_02605 [bacterium]|nr:hypothetical protein [bacterium]
MKEEVDLRFAILPAWEECFSVVFPVNLKIGDIFAGEGKNSHTPEYRQMRQYLRKVTNIEPLKNHPDHVVISSVLVGATIAQIICEKYKVSIWGRRGSENGQRKRFITSYYDEEHASKPGYFEEINRTEIYFISTNEKPVYYLVDVSKLSGAKIPIGEGSISLGRF